MAQAQSKVPTTATKAPAQGGPPRASTTAVAQRSGNQALTTKPTGAAATVRGWWDSATDWAGDKLNAASDAVTGAWNTTKRVANDVGDVVRSTSVGMKDGKLQASTDLDEVMDLLPESVRKSVQLDKSNPAANRANLSYDTKGGKLTVSVPDLQMKGMSAGGVTAGPTRLQGVVLTMDDAGAKARQAVKGAAGETVAGWMFGDEPKATKPQAPRTQLTVAKATAQDVSMQGGKAGAKQVDLGAVDVTLEGGDKGGAKAWFNVGSATLSGVHGAGTTADEVSGAGLSAHVAEAGESGSVGAERLAARGVVKDGQALGAGEVRGVAASFTNKGGGVPMADARPDTDLRTKGSVASANVANASAANAKVGAASARGVSWNSGGGAVDARAKAIDVDALDTEGVDARKAGATDLAVKASATGVDATAGSASVQGLDTKRLDVASANLKNLAMTRNAQGARGSAAQVHATGVSTPEAKINALSGSGVSVGSGQGTTSLAAKEAEISGLDTAKLDAATANARNLSFVNGPSQSRASADAIHAGGVRSDAADVASLDVGALDTRFAQGGTSTTAGSIALRGLDTKTLDVDAANARNVALSTGANASVKADALSASGVSATGAKVASLDARQVAAQRTSDGASASLGSATVRGIDTAAVDAGEVRAENVAARVGATSSLKAGSLSASDVRAQQGSAATVQVSGVDATAKRDANGVATSGTVSSIQAGGMASSAANVQNAAVDGLSWKVDGDNAAMKAASARAQGVTTAKGGVQSVALTDMGANYDKARQAGTAHLAGLHAEGLDAAGTKVKRVDAAGIIGQYQTGADGLGGAMRARSAEAEGIDGKEVDVARIQGEDLVLAARRGEVSAGLGQGSASGIDVQNPGLHATMRDAEVKGGEARLGTEGIDARADVLRAKGMAFDASFGGKDAPGASAPATTAPATTTGGKEAPKLDVLGLARKIDNADIQASVPLNAGKLSVAEVEEGTTANVRARVQGGRIDAANTGMTLDKPLDGPLWTEVNGVYLKEKEDGLHAKADVKGFVDMDVSKGLGGPLPSRVDQLVDRVAARPASTPSAGASGSATSSSGATSSGAATTGPVNTAGIKASGSAQLAAGELDMGAVKGELVRERPDDNAVQFKADGTGQLALQFARLLVGNLEVQNAAQTTTAGAVATSGASVNVAQGKGAQQVQGTVESVELRDIATKPRGR